MSKIESFPLCWPVGWKRTLPNERDHSRFRTTFERARQELFHELERMSVGDWNVILSTNLPLRRDGMPYSSGRPSLGDPGVALYFRRELEGKQIVIACDRWHSVADNMQAIRHTIAAIRGIERWGASDMLERAFTGFTALPAPEENKSWAEIFGVSEHADLDFIEEIYRMRMKKAHPDVGGSSDEARKLNQAIREVRELKGKR